MINLSLINLNTKFKHTTSHSTYSITVYICLTIIRVYTLYRLHNCFKGKLDCIKAISDNQGSKNVITIKIWPEMRDYQLHMRTYLCMNCPLKMMKVKLADSTDWELINIVFKTNWGVNWSSLWGEVLYTCVVHWRIFSVLYINEYFQLSCAPCSSRARYYYITSLTSQIKEEPHHFPNKSTYIYVGLLT
jgi:hypothetical protein